MVTLTMFFDFVQNQRDAAKKVLGSSCCGSEGGVIGLFGHHLHDNSPWGRVDKTCGQREIVFGLDDKVLKKVRSIPR